MLLRFLREAHFSQALLWPSEGQDESLVTFPDKAWPWVEKYTYWDGRSKRSDGGKPSTIWVCRNSNIFPHSQGKAQLWVPTGLLFVWDSQEGLMKLSICTG